MSGTMTATSSECPSAWGPAEVLVSDQAEEPRHFQAGDEVVAKVHEFLHECSILTVSVVSKSGQIYRGVLMTEESVTAVRKREVEKRQETRHQLELAMGRRRRKTTQQPDMHYYETIGRIPAPTMESAGDAAPAQSVPTANLLKAIVPSPKKKAMKKAMCPPRFAGKRGRYHHWRTVHAMIGPCQVCSICCRSSADLRFSHPMSWGPEMQREAKRLKLANASCVCFQCMTHVRQGDISDVSTTKASISTSESSDDDLQLAGPITPTPESKANTPPPLTSDEADSESMC